MSDSDRFIPDELHGLRDGVEAPDLSGAILQEVERRRGWLSRRQRRFLCAARWGLGGTLLGIVAGVLLVERYTPVDEAIVPEERALADLMQNVRDETSVAVRSVSTQVRSLPEQLVSQSRQIVLARIQRVGKARVVELSGPAVVVDEMSMDSLPQGWHGSEISVGDLLVRPDPNAWHRIAPGAGWPSPASISVGPELPESPLLQSGAAARSE